MANTAQGEAECCICHETPPQVLHVFYCTAQVYGAFTDLLDYEDHC